MVVSAQISEQVCPSQWLRRVLVRSLVATANCSSGYFEVYKVRILSPVLVPLCSTLDPRVPQYNLFPCIATPVGRESAGSWTTVLMSPPARLLDRIAADKNSTQKRRDVLKSMAIWMGVCSPVINVATFDPSISAFVIVPPARTQAIHFSIKQGRNSGAGSFLQSVLSICVSTHHSD